MVLVLRGGVGLAHGLSGSSDAPTLNVQEKSDLQIRPGVHASRQHVESPGTIDRGHLASPRWRSIR